MNYIKSLKVRNDAKKVFFKKGTCSRTFFYLLNREYGHPMDDEEQAADPLAGGILQYGYQCGMLWGSSMAAGAEAFRRCEDKEKATALAINTTQNIMASFKNKTGSIDCIDITKTNFKKKSSIPKFLFSGKFYHCFKLAGRWGPEAYDAAEEGLSADLEKLPNTCKSCASEMIKQLGGTDQEAVMVAGLAGGMGLSGNACGALAAAIWMKALQKIRNKNRKTSFSDPETEKMIAAFYEVTEYEMECKKITGRQFASLEEHTNYVESGGCEKLLTVLAN